MAEIVYPPVILLARAAFRVLGLRNHVEGSENVPTSGGAVLACTHVSYLDFIFVGLGAYPTHRLVRFMAKKPVFENKVAGPLMRGMHHIPVDRKAGAGAYDAALAALRAGELVGMFPEATISRSFEVKDLKTGAARLARDAGVPLLPVTVWGTQRLWTKGRPRQFSRRLVRRGLPITVLVGPAVPIAPHEDAETITARLADSLQALLTRAQRDYPDRAAGPDDTWWLPAALGGSAPTSEEAAAQDRAEGERS
jgi:1-acyl-sn-glycerol-3-phosphate acyltransferase